MSDTPVIYENPKEPWGGAVGHKFVRLTEPVYYVPNNPFTDSEGFLPHVGGKIPKWLWGKRVEVRDTDGNNYIIPEIMECNAWSDSTIAYRIVGEQEDQRPELPNEGRNQEQEDVEESLALLRKHNRNLYGKSGASENGDDPEQFASGNPVPFVEKPRSPSDATYPREALRRIKALVTGERHPHWDTDWAVTNSRGLIADECDRALSEPAAGHQYQDVYTEDERRHRNELAARTLAPVPGMDSFMHDVIREARKVRGLDDE